jgi:ribosome biogenesis GTPase A
MNKNIDNFFKIIDLMKNKKETVKKISFTKTIKIMVIGIPNVGKSSFINRLIGKNKAKTENRAGVTRGLQWFVIKNNVEMLDTAGVLAPKAANEEASLNLAFIGAIKSDILDAEKIAVNFIEKIKNNHLKNLAARFKLEKTELSNLSSYEIIEKIAQLRGMHLKNGDVDFQRVSTMLLNEFNSGKLGKITLEAPPGHFL